MRGAVIYMVRKKYMKHSFKSAKSVVFLIKLNTLAVILQSITEMSLALVYCVG